VPTARKYRISPSVVRPFQALRFPNTCRMSLVNSSYSLSVSVFLGSIRANSAVCPVHRTFPSSILSRFSVHSPDAINSSSSATLPAYSSHVSQGSAQKKMAPDAVAGPSSPRAKSLAASDLASAYQRKTGNRMAPTWCPNYGLKETKGQRVTAGDRMSHTFGVSRR
jgi:hypothetical protein